LTHALGMRSRRTKPNNQMHTCKKWNEQGKTAPGHLGAERGDELDAGRQSFTPCASWDLSVLL